VTPQIDASGGVSNSTTVSAESSHRWTVGSCKPSTIHVSRSTSRRWVASHSAAGVGTQPGCQKSASRWITSIPVASASV
jgi:hypothetical protein